MNISPKKGDIRNKLVNMDDSLKAQMDSIDRSLINLDFINEKSNDTLDILHKQKGRIKKHILDVKGNG